MSILSTFLRGETFLAAVTGLGLALPLKAATSEPAPKKEAPRVEIVFCLDTTGSMGGPIEGAKQKIWVIANQIASGKPTPRLKIGLVAFRDRGDVYITKIFDLTEDLDAIYSQLRQFRAQGGGDFPESVNQALHESVTRIKWSTDKETLRILFLVGDAPPHMDYRDDVKYPVTCRLAKEKGILINTIQCGSHLETRKFWTDICRQGGGEYVQIAANGGVVNIATPYDKELAEVNAAMVRSTLPYGDRARQLRGEARKDEAAKLPTASAAARASYNGKKGTVATYDLLDAINAGKEKLEYLKREQLPAQMQKMTPREQKTYLDKLNRQRADLNKKAAELDRKRNAYLKEKQTKGLKKARDGFDHQVLLILQKQAGAHHIEYKE